MIKKFMSKALLTIFMDKKARSTLHAIRKAKDTPKAPSKVDPKISVHPADAKMLNDMSNNEITDLIRESLETAKKEVVDEEKNTTTKSSKSINNQSREDLLENALNIFKSKSYIIDELPIEQRKKLKLLALKVFGEQLNDG